MKYILIISLLFAVLLSSAQNLDRAIALYDNKEPAKASSLLSSIKSNDASYAEAQFYLGRIAFDKESYGEAREYFEEAIEQEPSSSLYHTWLGNTLGSMARTAGRFKQARLAPKIKKAYEKAVKADPKNLDAQWGLVHYYSEAPGFMGGSWSKAIATAEAIGKIDPLEGQKALVEVYTQKDEPEKAEKAHLDAVKLDPKRLANLGIFYQNQGWYDKAFDTFEKAFAQFPDDMNLLYQTGRTSALSGKRLAQGIQSLERYLAETDVKTASPSHAGAKMRLAMIYEKKGNKRKAKEFYQAALTDEPDMELAKKGLKRVK